MNTQPRLTHGLINDITLRIKAGAFDDVAAQSAGVPLEIFRKWLAEGERAEGDPLCRLLLIGVREAQAQARFQLEMSLHEKDPKTWLLYGPGRQMAGRDGWAPAGKSTHQTAGAEHSLMDLCAILVAALEEYPEARAAAARALREHFPTEAFGGADEPGRPAVATDEASMGEGNHEDA
jgi:hypothetical protein